MSSLVAAAIGLILQVSAGEPAAIQVQADVTPDTVQIGERITLTVTVSGVVGAADIGFPELPDSGSVVALGPPSFTADRGIHTARYELAAWTIGDLALPRADVRVATDATELRVPLPGVTVHVISVLPADAEVDTLAWRPASDVLGPNWSLQEKLGALVLALALITATVFYLRRRGAVQPLPILPARSPRERAIEALERLEASGLLEAGELKGFYSALSHILREFLAGTENAWSLDLTTAEVMNLVGRDGVPETQVHTLDGLLAAADLVKFARRRPLRDRAADALDAARSLLVGFERLVPEPEPTVEEREPVSEEEIDDVEYEALSDLDAMFADDVLGSETPEDPEST